MATEPSTPKPRSPPGNGPVAIATGTFNTTNNSNLDLAVVNQTDGTVSILLGNGDGTFTKQPTDIKVGNGPVAIAVGNFNTNSITNNFPDLAVVNQTDGTVSILLGNGDGTFTKQPTDIKVGNGPVAIVAGSFDSVNNSEYGLGRRQSNGQQRLDPSGQRRRNVLNGGGRHPGRQRSDGESRPETSTPPAPPTTSWVWPSPMAPTGPSRFFSGNGQGAFSTPTPATIDTQTDPAAILSADFNNDGVPDLAVANEGSDSVSVFLGDRQWHVPASAEHRHRQQPDRLGRGTTERKRIQRPGRRQRELQTPSR